MCFFFFCRGGGYGSGRVPPISLWVLTACYDRGMKVDTRYDRGMKVDACYDRDMKVYLFLAKNRYEGRRLLR